MTTMTMRGFNSPYLCIVCAPIVYFPPLPPTATATATQLASLAPDVVVSGLTPPTTGTSPSSSARLPPFVVVTEVPPPPIEYARPPSTEQQAIHSTTLISICLNSLKISLNSLEISLNSLKISLNSLFVITSTSLFFVLTGLWE